MIPGSIEHAKEAQRRGFRRSDFARVLNPLDPIEFIDAVHPDSRLIVGRYDRLIPRVRSQTLIERARKHLREPNIVELPVGHFGVLAVGAWLQRRWTPSVVVSRTWLSAPP